MGFVIREGKLSAAGFQFGIVVARFNSFITDRLLDGALDALRRSGADDAQIEVVRVPGAWEMPMAARAMAKAGKYDALICLGAVIRGDTPHFDFVAGEAATGLSRVSAEFNLPLGFGVLTTNSVEQAIDRAGAKAGNKGFDAAMTAIEMANLLRDLQPKA